MALSDDARRNRRRFLDFIGWSEGADYDTIVGLGKSVPGAPARFTDFSTHPRVIGWKSAKGDTSDAAGRYQILGSTYDDLHKRFPALAQGPELFGRSAQDEYALRLIQDKGALADVDAGNWRAAINKLGATWASFPSSKYDQPKRSWPEAMSFFGGTGAPTEMGETPGTMVTSENLMDMYRQAMQQAETYERQVGEQEKTLLSDYATRGQEVNQAEEVTRQQIMNRPIQEERGVGQRAIASILGGATQRGVQDEEDLRRKQIEAQHQELTELSINRTKRLADAYYKMGDIVNAVKYTAAAQKAAAARKDAMDLAKQAAQLSSNERVAQTYADARGAGAAAALEAKNVMTAEEYSKALNTAVTQFKSTKRNPLALRGLKTEIVNMRHIGQTPLSWVKNLFYGVLPPGDRKWWGLVGGDKGLFDVKSNADQEQIAAALDNLFTPKELNDPNTGTAAIISWLAAQRGSNVGTTGEEESPTLDVSVGKAKARIQILMDKIVAARKVQAAGPLSESIRKQIDEYVQEINQLQRALKTIGAGINVTEEMEYGVTTRARQ